MKAFDRNRPAAQELAVATGARVLTVACSPEGAPSHDAAVERGLAAYAWLLCEGCEVDLTAFTDNLAGAVLAQAILVAAARQGLPAPAGGIQATVPGPWPTEAAARGRVTQPTGSGRPTRKTRLS